MRYEAKGRHGAPLPCRGCSKTIAAARSPSTNSSSGGWMVPDGEGAATGRCFVLK